MSAFKDAPKRALDTIRSTKNRAVDRLRSLHKIQLRTPQGRVRLRVHDAVKRIFNPTLRAQLGPERTHRWSRVMMTLLHFGGASEGNTVRLYNDTGVAWLDKWAAMGNANKSIKFEAFEMAPDKTGSRTLTSLQQAAERGLDVTLIYDSLGSHKFTFNWKTPMLENLKVAGVRVVEFNPIFAFTRQFWKRNHRKNLIVDGVVGFTGGLNVTDDYCGKQAGGTGFFRDTHMRLVGPCVADLNDVFSDSLSVFAGTFSASALHSSPPQVGTLETHPPTSGPYEWDNMFLQVLRNNSFRKVPHVKQAIRLAIGSSITNCYITNPYFIPPVRLRRAMTGAAQRGVDIRILMSGRGRSDVPIARWASQHIYHHLLVKGVRIFELQDRVLHAKTITVDGVFSSIGSFNFDHWSSSRNLEMVVTSVDPRLANGVEAQFHDDLSRSKEITLEDLEKRTAPVRFFHWVCYLVAQL